MQSALSEADAAPKVRLVGVAFLLVFRRCAVIAAGDDGSCRAVIIEGGIQWTVRGKECDGKRL